MTSITTPQEITTEKLSIWRKIGYGLGDVYGGGANTLVTFYYLFFLTDVVLLNPGYATAVLVISKIYDAITDPLEGVLSDRTRTRLGRRRPYILIGIPFVFLSFFTLFFPINFENELYKFAYVLFAFLFYSTIFSIVMLNYNAVQSEMTLDYNERTALSTWRISFSTIASLVAAGLPLIIVDLFPDLRDGYIAMALFFGIFFALPYIATFFAIREREEFQKAPKKLNWREVLIDPFLVKTFVLALVMFFLTFTAMDVVSSIVIYFMKYYMVQGDETNFVLVVLMISQIISLPFYGWLSKRTSKKIGFILGSFIWMITMLCGLLIGPHLPKFTIYIFAAVVGLGTGGIIVMIYSIFPDIPDVDELQSQERREGIYSSLTTLVRKLSTALGLFLVGTTIAIAGYKKPIEEVIDGATKMIEQEQTASFILVLRLIFTFIPVILVGAGIIASYFYPLSPDRHNLLRLLLQKRRAGVSETEEMKAETEVLTNNLIRWRKV